jgi:predicted AAA+ superfamily ATPase
MIIPRLILNQLQESLLPGKVLVLYGPRQVGKTTLARELISSLPLKSKYINADELIYRDALASQDRAQLQEVSGGAELLVIDEAQRVPNIGINLKILVDNFPDLKILATGSASFDLANKISEPLTGRKIIFTLYPLSYTELRGAYGSLETRSQLERWLVWGSYPSMVITMDMPLRERLLNELVSSYLYKDLLELEDIRRSIKLVNLLRLLAFQIGVEVSIAELSSNLSISFPTVQRYLDLLEKVFVIFKVEGFSRNLRKEISKNARYYFYDNGVRNALIQNFNPLSLRDDAGQLWENYLYIERRKANQLANKSVNTYFWRTYDQKEIDYIEESAGKISGYEFGIQKTSIRQATKTTFLDAYPGSSLMVVNRDNFESFVVSP